MSTSIVHVLTVIGKGGEEVEAACEQLLSRRVERHPKSYGADDWSAGDQKRIENLCTALIRTSRKLPVYYYAQYLDSWSVAASQFRLLTFPDGKRRLLYGTDSNVTYFPSTFAQHILSEIKRRRRTKLYRTQTEDRWFLDHVKDATEDALRLEANFTVVCISQSFDASRQHEEIKASLNASIDLR